MPLSRVLPLPAHTPSAVSSPASPPACRLARLLLIVGALVLAAEPLGWLLASWLDPAYNPAGLAVAALTGALFVWSLSSAPALVPGGVSPSARRRQALMLLLLTALVRLAGQVLGINVVGALALVLDVYALALLAGLAQRRRALAPGWLALLFAFALPLERVVQRLSGYWLQQVSADGACALLTLAGSEARCQGLRILWHGRDVLVDLPCSGAAGLTLLLTFYCLLAAVCRPRPAFALAGVALALAAAWFANVLRIVVLAAGFAYQPRTGIDVLAAPWHELIGLVALLAGALPLLWYCRRFAGSRPGSRSQPLPPLPAHGGSTIDDGAPGVPAAALTLPAAGFALLAGAIVLLPARPLDVATPLSASELGLPATIAGLAARPVALDEREAAYFRRYGGGAGRAHYGPFGLLLVTTTAPLRHLHAPDECLTGAGYRVRYLGVRYDRLPSALYRAIAADGRRWRIAVTYVSDRGETATSVSEAVWRWLQNPGSRWTMVQRYGPSELPLSELIGWDHAVARALELPSGNADPARRLSI